MTLYYFIAEEYEQRTHQKNRIYLNTNKNELIEKKKEIEEKEGIEKVHQIKQSEDGEIMFRTSDYVISSHGEDGTIDEEWHL